VGSRVGWLSGLLLALSSVLHPLAAQPCDPALTSTGGFFGYQLRADPPRCEGFYEQEVSAWSYVHELLVAPGSDRPVGGDLALTSVTTLPAPQGTPEPGAILSLAWSSVDTAGVRISVSGIETAAPYRMDATADGPRGSLDWPVDLLARRSIAFESLGFLAWGRTPTDGPWARTYVPVHVGSDASPADAQGSYRATVVTRTTLDDVAVSLARRSADGSLDYLYTDRRLGTGPYPAGSEIAIDLAPPDSGVYQVDISAVDDFAAASFLLQHEPGAGR
jgi:hypothetical protein